MNETISGTSVAVNPPSFGTWLRHWRMARGLSQLALAGEAGISTRHLSFLETGRSLPSRDMVRLLADSLEVPATDRNVFLLAAGYAPSYPTEDFAAGEFQALERVLEFIIAHQKAFPALVIDEAWNIRMRNDIAVEIFAGLRRSYDLPDAISSNALHVLCHPRGLRQFVENWAEYAGPFVREINREATMTASETAQVLSDEIHDYPGVPALIDGTGPNGGMMQPVMTLRLRINGRSLAFHTAFTTFVLPFAARPRPVKIEVFYPADPETVEAVEAAAAALE